MECLGRRWVVAGEQIDYTPRKRRGERDEDRSVPLTPRRRLKEREGKHGEDGASPRERKARASKGEDSYAPRPARRSRAAGRPRRSTSSRGAKGGRFFERKNLGRLAALAAILILVVPTVLVAVVQTRPSGTIDPAEYLARLEENPDDLAALVALGNHYYDEGLAWWNQGDGDLALQSFAVAAGYYEQAVRQDPANTDMRTDLGTMYFYQGSLWPDSTLVDQAIQTWSEVLALEPDKVEAIYNLGVAYDYQGQSSMALAAWQRVIEVAPGSDYARDAQRRIEEIRGP